MFYQWGTYDPIISDHNLIYTARKKHKLSKDGTKTSCRNYNKLNDKDFQVSVDEEDWSEILSSDNCNHAAELFAPAWITNEYLAHRDERKYHCRKLNKNPNSTNKLLKEEAIERCNALKLSLQCTYFREALARHAGDMTKCGQKLKSFGHI